MSGRLLRILGGVGLLLLAQGLAVLLYLSREGPGGGEEGGPLQYERLSGEESAPEIVFLREGQEARLSEYRGKPVLLHFWATWCVPCRKELPALLPFARALAESRGLVLLAVSTDETFGAVERFFQGEVPPEFVWDASGESAGRYGVSTLPETYLISPSGRLLLRFSGPQDWGDPRARSLLEGTIGDR